MITEQQKGCSSSCSPSTRKKGTPGDQALRAVGPSAIFDAIELYDPAGLERLRHYAENPDAQPVPGFWTEAEIAAQYA